MLFQAVSDEKLSTEKALETKRLKLEAVGQQVTSVDLILFLHPLISGPNRPRSFRKQKNRKLICKPN